MKLYRNEKWFTFKEEIIELDGHACTNCGRTSKEVILQVHHKKYIKGHPPWEYAPKDCETLCKGCHAREHGEIRPNSGWDLVYQEDLGSICGICELCGANLRHVFFIQHKVWEPMAVGTNCCDSLTENEATKFNKNISRRKRFVSSTRWEKKTNGLFLTQNKIRVGIIFKGSKYKIRMDQKEGNKEFISEKDAKEFAFEIIENGKAQNYLKSKNKFRYTL